MKNFSKKIVGVCLALVMALAMAVALIVFVPKKQPLTAEAATSTTTIHWALNGNTLDISGNSFTGSQSFTPTSANAPWRSSKANIQTINIKDSIAPVDIAGWFNGTPNLTTINNISYLDVSNITSFNCLFYACSNLTTLDLSDWDVSNVTDMDSLFSGCSKLKVLDISSWKPSKIENMCALFEGCSSLPSVDLSDWVTSNVTNMRKMFYNCSSLTTVGDLSNWETTQAQSMRQMFTNCSKLTSLNLSKFDLSNTVYFDDMLTGLSEIKDITLSDSLIDNIGSVGLFNSKAAWYDDNVNEYTATNPMTAAGTYSPCKHQWATTWSKDDTNHWHACENGCTRQKDVVTHTWGTTWTSDANTHWHACTECGEKNDEAAHTWGGWVTKTAANCTNDEVQEHTCSSCNTPGQQTLTNSKLGHLYGAPTWDWATDHSSATAVFTCTRNGCTDVRRLTATVTPQTVAATCTTAGSITSTATISVTGTEFGGANTYVDTQTTPVSSLGHNYSTDWSSDDNKHWHECANDITHRSAEAAHNWDTGTVTTAPTCSATGVRTLKCQICQKTKTEEIAIDPIAHNFLSAWIKDDNNHWHACEYNSSHKTAEAPHDWDAGVINKYPTATAKGEKEFTCNTCGQKKILEFAAGDNSITGLALVNWTYGDPANTPTATAIFGTIKYTYSESENGTYSATVPTNAGTY